MTLENNIRIAVENCNGSVAVRTVFISRHKLSAGQIDERCIYLPFKRVLSSMSMSAVIALW